MRASGHIPFTFHLNALDKCGDATAIAAAPAAAATTGWLIARSCTQTVRVHTATCWPLAGSLTRSQRGGAQRRHESAASDVISCTRDVRQCAVLWLFATLFLVAAYVNAFNAGNTAGCGKPAIATTPQNYYRWMRIKTALLLTINTQSWQTMWQQIASTHVCVWQRCVQMLPHFSCETLAKSNFQRVALKLINF